MAAIVGPLPEWYDSSIDGIGPALWYGPAAIDGAAGAWQRAPLGSIYVQIDASGATAQTWLKRARAGATADWVRMTGLAGLPGGQTLYGGTAANEDLTLVGTSHATKTTSYVTLQPDGGAIALGVGSAAVPALQFVGDTTVGLYHVAANQLGFASNGNLLVMFGGNNGFRFDFEMHIDWCSGSPIDAGIDLTLWRSNVGLFGLKRAGSNAARQPAGMTIESYFANGGVNREYIHIGWSGSNALIQTVGAGDGISEPLILYANGGQVYLSGTHFMPNTALDLGRTDSVHRWVTVFATTIDATGAVQLTEMAAPSAGAANTARVYAVDNGAGKTQLMVQFATGVAQQIAIEA